MAQGMRYLRDGFSAPDNQKWIGPVGVFECDCSCVAGVRGIAAKAPLAVAWFTFDAPAAGHRCICRDRDALHATPTRCIASAAKSALLKPAGAFVQCHDRDLLS